MRPPGNLGRHGAIAEINSMTSRLADPQQHDDLLNYQLKRLVKYGGAPAIRLCEGRYGVTRTEWRVLASLVEGGACTPSQLAERGFMQRPVVSRLLTLLLRKRLARHVSAAGARVEVEATVAGRRLYAELFPQLAQINRRLMAVLDEREAQQLEHILAKLWLQARRVHEEGGGVEVRADRRRGGSRRRWEAVTGQHP
jgi:DNA-binding MarR family transcriptional regulator